MSRSILDVIVAKGQEPLFSMPLGERREGWEVRLTREGVWERYRTLGQVAVLEGRELEVSSFLFWFFLLLFLVCEPLGFYAFFGGVLVV